MPLADGLCRELLLLAQGKHPDEPVFSPRYADLAPLWMQVREAANPEHVRLKDLHTQVAFYGDEAGVPLTVPA